jgi:hypothetical protein
LHVHGTSRAFKAASYAHTEHQAQRDLLVERTGKAVRSIKATTTASIVEKPEAAAKELAQAWVKIDTPERARRAVAGQLHGEDHAVRVRAGTRSVAMPVAAGDRLVLRSGKNLSLALQVKLEEPMAATLRLNSVARGADGVLRATAMIESNNERDRRHTVTLDEDNLKWFRHGYATTQKDAAKNPRPHVFALVGDRDAPARVIGTLEPASQASVFATPKAAKAAENAAASRDAVRQAMEKRQSKEQARQEAAKQQAKEEKEQERATAKRLVPQQGGGRGAITL